VDDITREQRRRCMSAVRSLNTKPEIILRRTLWHNGIRGYRLRSRLVGHPDLYFPGMKLAVFVDGCFWHGCRECKRIPSTRSEFWSRKISANRKRDRIVDSKLAQSGITVVRMWEHEVLDDPELCLKKIAAILEDRRRVNRGPLHVSSDVAPLSLNREMS
jgi:DNA mismatch endonuclease (patch repair protein)